MQVEITPRRLEVLAGQPQPISVTITNTGDLIAGFVVRVLGADPSWVEFPDSELSLFPSESRTVVATVTVPPGINAGERRISVQVRELTPPEASSIDEIVLRVPDAPMLNLRVDPLAATSGRSARFSLLVENAGNTSFDGQVLGQDPERRVRFRFDPPSLALAPGEHGVVDVRATARQALFGSPTLRVLTLAVGKPAPPAPAAVAPAAPVEAAEAGQPTEKLVVSHRRPRRTRKTPAAPLPDDIATTHATFVQKAAMTRGPLSLLGLLLAVTVFAVVITVALSRLVGQSAADRNLALEIASARDNADSSAASGTGVGGAVTLLTSGAAVPGVAVAVYAAGDTAAPVATTATDDSGAWAVNDLPTGDYKVTFRGAGFVQLWYPQAIDASNAQTISLDAGAKQLGLDVALGGVPASIAGKVVGDDVSTATLTLRTPVGTPVAGADPTATDAEQGAQVMSVPIGSDGTFQLDDVPSPSVYDLVVTKTGFATSTQRIDVSAGEERTGVEISLRQGDGVISGVLSSPSGPLGGATVTATSGTTTVTTMTLTEGDVGAFTLRGLSTPGDFTVVASLAGYASQTMTLSLGDGQRLTGVGMTLGQASGAISGLASLDDGTPATGVAVTVTDGAQTVQTATQSSKVDGRPAGSWTATGLSLPGTYTVTFSRSDLSSQTVSVVLDSAGNVTEGASGAKGSVDVTMQPSTAVLEGVISQSTAGGGSSPAGEVTVTLSSGSATYTVTTASVPSALAGHYRIEGIPPGTYTVSTSRSGVTPTSTILELAAGEDKPYSVTLAAAASISGTVLGTGGNPVGAGWVVELYRSDSYPGTVYLTTRTGADGTFSFPDVDAPQAYVIQVRRTTGAAPAGTRTLQVGNSQAVTTTVSTQ